MKPKDLNPFDIYIGIEEARPLVRLFIEAFIKFQNNDLDIKTYFINLLEKDLTTVELFQKINLTHSCDESSLRYFIRIGILILNNEVGHQLIFILTGLDVRGILICAHFISQNFSKIILNLDTLTEIEEGYIAYVLNEEILSIKSLIDKL